MAHGGSAGGVSAQPPYHALPSIAQRRALLNIAARRPYCTGLPGSGELWWHTITQAALRRKGLITDTNELTDAGRAMVERLTGRGV
ncbi:MAG: hypothetical protein LBE62_02330 [Azonexus sp.]|jgi:hypothetical protein|nr:hypothetical protein [Azonexus sp.]